MLGALVENTINDCKISSLHREVTKLLSEGRCETPSLDARLLICEACDVSYERFVAYPDLEVSLGQLAIIRDYVQRRLSGEPISRIFGEREFWGHSFALNSDTLDPRSDTETLVEFTLELLSKKSHINDEIRILDLGVGSGCVILSLLQEIKQATGVGVDISFDALLGAQENARRLKLQDRIDFIQTDWLDGINETYDVIVSNPPYIPTKEISGLMPEVRCYDPIRALDGGMDGLEAYRQILDQIEDKLNNNGFVVFEIGAGQEIDIKNMLMSYNTRNTFSNISYKCDLKGIVRCIAAEIKNETCGC